MELSFSCQFCDQSLTVDDTMKGQEVACPTCGTTIKIPVPDLRGTRRIDVAAPPSAESEPIAAEIPKGILSGPLTKFSDWLADLGDTQSLQKQCRIFKWVGDIALLVMVTAWIASGLFKGSSATGAAAAPPPKTDPGASEAATLFTSKVEPILKSRCYECHGSDPAKTKGKLNLTTRAGLLNDGAVVPGDPGKSKVAKRIVDTGDPMPPKPPLLTKEQIDDIRKWITLGAATSSGPSVNLGAFFKKVPLLLGGLLLAAMLLIVHFTNGLFLEGAQNRLDESPTSLRSTRVQQGLSTLLWFGAWMVLLICFYQTFTVVKADPKIKWLVGITNLMAGAGLCWLIIQLAKCTANTSLHASKNNPSSIAAADILAVLTLPARVVVAVAPILYGLLVAFASLYLTITLLLPKFAPTPTDWLGWISKSQISLASAGLDLSVPKALLIPMYALLISLVATLFHDICLSLASRNRD